MEEKQVSLEDFGIVNKPRYVDGANIKLFVDGIKGVFKGILEVKSKNDNVFKVLVFETHLAKDTYIPTWCVSQDSHFPLFVNKEYKLVHVADKILRVENV